MWGEDTLQLSLCHDLMLLLLPQRLRTCSPVPEHPLLAARPGLHVSPQASPLCLPEIPSMDTYSRSSSFMSSNAPRSTTPIWFSISCLGKQRHKDSYGILDKDP